MTVIDTIMDHVVTTIGRRTFKCRLPDDNTDYSCSRYPTPSPLGNPQTNLVSSMLDTVVDGEQLHAITIDLDLPCYLVESSTPGHFHLYIEKAITWKEYKAILTSLAQAGIIQTGFYRAALDRGATFLRLPSVKKTKKEPQKKASNGV